MTAFYTVHSNTPLDLNSPLISFKVRGCEVAVMMPNGKINVSGIGFPDGYYIAGEDDVVAAKGIDGGTFDPIDDGTF